MKHSLVAVPALASLLLLGACSSSAQDGATPTPNPSSSTAPSASPSDTQETFLAVLCDAAAEDSVAAIEAALKPDFTITQVADVRTDDEGMHAVVGFVEGPGLAVLATWTGTGLGLEGLAAADDFASQVTEVPVAEPDDMTQSLIGQTVPCYTNVFGPDQDDEADQDGKKDKKDKKKKKDGDAQ